MSESLQTTQSGDSASRRRRIRRLGIAAWVFLPVFTVAGLWWLYRRLLLCGSERAHVSLCEYSFAVPLLLLSIALGLFAFVLHDVRAFGRDIQGTAPEEQRRLGRARRWAAQIRRGYWGLDETCRFHVRWTFFIATINVAAHIGLAVFYLRQPALAAMLTGAVIAYIAFGINCFWLSGEESAPVADLGTRKFEDVLEAELDHIKRARAKLPISESPAGSRGAPGQTQEIPLNGIALSGGGIRSATFNLGIIQALCEARRLRMFDYLSTVSGGGYIGSWLSAQIAHRIDGDSARLDEIEAALTPSVIATTDTPASTETKAQPPKPQEDRTIGFLRDYSNYLTPRRGLLSTDTLSGAAAYLRNLILVQTMVIALLLAILLVPRLLHSAAAFLQQPYFLLSGWMVWLGVLCFAYSFEGIVQNLNAPLDISQEKSTHKSKAGTAYVIRYVIAPACAGAFLVSIEIADGSSEFAQWGVGSFALGMALFYGTLTAMAAARSLHHALPKAIVVVSAAFGAGAVGGTGLYAFGRLMEFIGGGPLSTWFAVTAGPFLILWIQSLMIVFHLGLIGRIFDSQIHEWWARYGAWIIAVTIGGGGLFVLGVYSPVLVEYGRGWLLYAGAPAWLVSTAWAVLKGASSTTDGKSSSRTELLLRFGPYVFILGLAMLLSHGIHRVLTPPVPIPEIHMAAANVQCGAEARLGDGQNDSRGAKLQCETDLDASTTPSLKRIATITAAQMSGVPAGHVAGAFIGLLFIFMILMWRLDINLFSFHNFYRNRLTRCYLGAARAALAGENARKPHPFTGFDPQDDLPLHHLRSASDKGSSPAPDHRAIVQRPYHILNTALNMSSGSNLAWQQRKAASFFFSPLYCGFELPAVAATASGYGGFVRTDRYMRGGDRALGPAQDTGPMLGSVVAVSGAAASPNWGFHTSPAVAFMLTLFNVRLGRWYPNPAYVPVPGRQSPLFGARWLLAELFGHTNASSPYIYLSDGGHFDNLGIYELVRRRVQLIVVCDCGQDVGMAFDDLADTIRKCYTDFGARIVIDVRPIEKTTSSSGHPFSEDSVVTGTIEYAGPPSSGDGVGTPQRTGKLILVKPALTVEAFRDAPDVRNYALANKEFPQQTTADQWFDEAQFESYRKLGYLIGKRLIDKLDELDAKGSEDVASGST